MVWLWFLDTFLIQFSTVLIQFWYSLCTVYVQFMYSCDTVEQLYQNCTKLYQNCTQLYQNCTWYSFDTVRYSFVQLHNCPKTVSWLYHNCTATVSRLYQNCTKTVPKLYQKLYQNCSTILMNFWNAWIWSRRWTKIYFFQYTNIIKHSWAIWARGNSYRAR